MAKKKSKGFIVPSINFITMHRPAQSGDADVARPLPEIKNPEQGKQEARQPETKEPLPEKPKAVKPELMKSVALEQKGNGRKKSALSLSSLKRNKQEAEELRQKKARENKTENLPQDSFTQETFNKVWQDYIDGLIQGGEKILASVLMADKPVLKDHMIHLTYPNQLMKKELLRVRPKVLRHIRSALNNHAVDFEIEVKEENQKRFAYTPQEKYELLKEKNSDISFLRKTFNLEL
jgi:DNA polymerase-3 subunit gamma/tau